MRDCLLALLSGPHNPGLGAHPPHIPHPTDYTLQKAFRPAGKQAGIAPTGLSAKQEAELQRVLEEEIVREMEREQALSQVRGLTGFDQV